MGSILTPNRPLEFTRFRAIEKLAAIRERLYTQDAATSLHWGEVIYLALVALLAMVSWAGLVLAEFGSFSLTTLSVPLALTVVGIAIALRRLRRWTQITWTWDILGALPALVLAVALFTPPFEFILGGADPGVYVSTGANIARTGSIVIVDDELASLAPDIRRDLVRTGNRLPGFYITDFSRGVIEPHGFHLYPVQLAIAYAFGGVWASLWVSPIVAILALVGFYLLVRRLFGTGVAFVAALLLVANPAVIWFARYPAAENLVFLWLMGGLLAFVLAHDAGDRWLAALAGAILAMVHLTKIEVVALPVALTMFLAYQGLARRWRAEYWYLLVAYGLIVLHAILHAHLVATWYSHNLLQQVVLGRLNGRYAEIFFVLCLIGGLLVGFGRNWVARMLNSSSWWSYARHVAALGVLALAAYAYYVRPRTSGITVPIATSTPEEAYHWANSASFLILGWYVSPLGLLLAVIGYVTALTRAGTARTAIVLLLAVLEVALHLSEGRIRPVHFWAARRWVPLVFPAFALFSGYVLWHLQRSLRGRWPEALTPVLLGVVMFVSCFGGWLPFLGHVEYQGAIAQVDTLASKIPEDGVVLFDDSNTGQTLAIPLQYIWGRTVFIIPKQLEVDGSAGRLIADWLAEGRAVYWIRNGVPQDIAYWIEYDVPPNVERWGFKAELIGRSTVDLPYVFATVDHRPDTIARLRFGLQIYQVVPLTD